MEGLTPTQFNALSVLISLSTSSGQRLFKGYLLVISKPVHIGSFYRVMNALVKRGYATKSGQGRRKPVRYTITTLGRDVYEDYIYEREKTNGN